MNYIEKLHAEPDVAGESEVLSRGRLVKARLPDRPVPNVGWFWIATGNCLACKHYAPGGIDRLPRCTNEDIPDVDFQNKYLYVNTCPGYAAGFSQEAVDAGRDVIQDVMRAVGLAEGSPTQRVEVIVNEPWSVDLTLRAHREEGIFYGFACDMDYRIRTGTTQADDEFGTDLSDDLEGPTKPWPIIKELRAEGEALLAKRKEAKG